MSSIIETVNYDKNTIQVFETMASVPNSLYIVTSAIGQGKSIFTMSYINYLKKIHKKKYDKIIIISPTIFNGYYTKNGIPKADQYDDISIEQLKIIQEYQKKHPNKKLLLVMDDIFSSNLSLKSDELDKIIATMRHYGISILFILQNIYMISRKIRSNSHGLIIFSISGHQNLKALHDAISCGESFREFSKNFYQNVKDHKGLFINSLKGPLDQDRIIPFLVNIKKFSVKL